MIVILYVICCWTFYCSAMWLNGFVFFIVHPQTCCHTNIDVPHDCNHFLLLMVASCGIPLSCIIMVDWCASCWLFSLTLPQLFLKSSTCVVKHNWYNYCCLFLFPIVFLTNCCCKNFIILKYYGLLLITLFLPARGYQIWTSLIFVLRWGSCDSKIDEIAIVEMI